MTEKYLWYKHLPCSNENIEVSSDLKIYVFKPSGGGYKIPEEHNLNVKVKVLRIFFKVISHGKFKIYYVENDGKVIHTSYVMPSCWKFPFLKNDEYEIGPCQTDPDYRGRGIYPSVLKQIVYDNKNTTFYMMVAENNHSSIKGIEKAGFRRQTGYLTVSCLKRYKKCKGK